MDIDQEVLDWALPKMPYARHITFEQKAQETYEWSVWVSFQLSLDPIQHLDWKENQIDSIQDWYKKMKPQAN